jgi:hypothetical protein
VLPVIGDMKIADVRTRHLVELAMRWRTAPLERTGEPMAPHTLRNINGVVNLMFRDAEIAGVIEHAPRPLNRCAREAIIGARFS